MQKLISTKVWMILAVLTIAVLSYLLGGAMTMQAMVNLDHAGVCKQ